MTADNAGMRINVIQELPRSPGVFRGNDITCPQSLNQPTRYVTEIAERASRYEEFAQAVRSSSENSVEAVEIKSGARRRAATRRSIA